MTGRDESVDVLIVGSGPVGSAFARTVHEGSSAARILMLEVGPRLTERPGLNVRNLTDPEARARAEALSQGREADAVRAELGERPAVSARPGTHLLRRPAPGASDQDGMPAAAMSTNVGGMGAHWTCACPPPGGSERIPFLDEAELEADLAVARGLLSVTADGFPDTELGRTVLAALGRAFDADLPLGRKVQRMPLACLPRPGAAPTWAGADTVLGPLADGPDERFELRPETLCKRLETDGGSVEAVVVEDLSTGREQTIRARAVVVAADAFRTPQLLWASGIRHPALGRYLNDQPQVIAAAQVAAATTSGARLSEEDGLGAARDQLSGVSLVPFADGVHPFHGQVMQIDASPIALGVEDESASIVGLGWFCAKELRAEDRVAFSERETDAYGMPAMTIDYALTAQDRESIRGAIEAQRRAAEALGGLAPRGEPMLLPAGSSLHYQGTVRMGEVDDGTSVCDLDSRVWGLDNVFVGGNGVIPTATACNPTLTSVALAVRAARRIGHLLESELTTHAH